MSYQQGTLYLPATYIGAQPSPGKDEIGGGFGNNSGPRFSPSPGAMEPLHKHLTKLTADALDAMDKLSSNGLDRTKQHGQHACFKKPSNV